MTTLNLQVGASGDDGEWRVAGSLQPTNSVSMAVGSVFGDPASQWARFTNVTIANSSTISVGTLTLTSAQTRSEATCSVTVNALAEDNATNPSSTADANGRTRTTSNVSWTIPAETLDSTYSPSDISASIQEVVNRAGWASGNAIVIFIENAAASARRFHRTYDGSTTKAPKLDITYTAGGGGTTVTPGVASLTTSPGTPALTTAIPVTAASLTITAATPTVGVGLSPGPASLTISGATPALVTAIPVTAATLNTSMGTAAIALGLNPSAASLSTTGATPSLDTAIAPAAVALALSTVAPSLEMKLALAALALTTTLATPTVTVATSTATKNLVDVNGSYAPIVGIQGSYTPTINASGSYAPTIDVTGRAS